MVVEKQPKLLIIMKQVFESSYLNYLILSGGDRCLE